MFGFYPYGKKDFRNLFDLIGWYFVMVPQWKNLLYHNKYYGKINGIPKIKNLNIDSLSWMQEKCIPLNMSDKELIINNFNIINEQLKANNKYIIDIHSKNIMKNNDNQVIFVDGEIISPIMLVLLKILYYFIGNQMVPIQKFDRIYWSNEEYDRTPPITTKDDKNNCIQGAYDSSNICK